MKHAQCGSSCNYNPSLMMEKGSSENFHNLMCITMKQNMKMSSMHTTPFLCSHTDPCFGSIVLSSFHTPSYEEGNKWVIFCIYLSYFLFPRYIEKSLKTMASSSLSSKQVISIRSEAVTRCHRYMEPSQHLSAGE